MAKGMANKPMETAAKNEAVAMSIVNRCGGFDIIANPIAATAANAPSSTVAVIKSIFIIRC